MPLFLTLTNKLPATLRKLNVMGVIPFAHWPPTSYCHHRPTPRPPPQTKSTWMPYCAGPHTCKHNPSKALGSGVAPTSSSTVATRGGTVVSFSSSNLMSPPRVCLAQMLFSIEVSSKLQVRCCCARAYLAASQLGCKNTCCSRPRPKLAVCRTSPASTLFPFLRSYVLPFEPAFL